MNRHGFDIRLIIKGALYKMTNLITNMPTVPMQKKTGVNLPSGLNGMNPKMTMESFSSFLGDQAAGFLTEVRNVEEKVSRFTKGKIDIEEVAPEVSAMSIKVEAMSRIIETVKNALDKLLSTQM